MQEGNRFSKYTFLIPAIKKEKKKGMNNIVFNGNNVSLYYISLLLYIIIVVTIIKSSTKSRVKSMTRYMFQSSHAFIAIFLILSVCILFCFLKFKLYA